MLDRLAAVAELAAVTDAVVTARQLDELGVPKATRNRWVRSGVLVRLGVRSFVVGGAPLTWARTVRAAVADLAPDGVAAGRSAARLHMLDGFDRCARVELLVPRCRRGVVTSHTVRSTRVALGVGDVVRRDGIATLSAERLILDAPLFHFGRREVENAIDSALRLRLVSESRLRARVEQRTGLRLRRQRGLVDALVDAGDTAAWSDGSSRWSARHDCPGRSSNASTATVRGRWPESMPTSRAGWSWRSPVTPPTPHAANASTTNSGVPS